MKRPPANVAQSLRDRLLKAARANSEEFTYALTRYGLERLLARLAASTHADTFVLKGAMLFRVWSPTLHRPTKDLDLLATGAPDLERLATVFADVCSVTVEEDGMVFDPKTVRAERIKEDADYEGVRVRLRAMLGSARIDLQIDIGFGDAITPHAMEVDFPTMLVMASPRLRAYPKETVVAEKLQAMVHLGIANSRMKDFFDLWFLARSFAFHGVTLATAIAATFARRKTPLEEYNVELSYREDFSVNETLKTRIDGELEYYPAKIKGSVEMESETRLRELKSSRTRAMVRFPPDQRERVSRPQSARTPLAGSDPSSARLLAAAPTDGARGYVEDLSDLAEAGAIGARHRRVLKRAQARLGLSDEQAEKLERAFFAPQDLNANETEYVEELEDCLADNVITEDERRILSRRAQKLGIPPDRAETLEVLTRAGVVRSATA